eukprot:1347729-Amphidinium_carterae.3
MLTEQMPENYSVAQPAPPVYSSQCTLLGTSLEMRFACAVKLSSDKSLPDIHNQLLHGKFALRAAQ